MPSFTQTAVVRLPIWIYNRTVGVAIGQFTGASAAQEPFLDEAGANALNLTSSQAEQQNGAIDAATAPNANGEIKKRKARTERR